MECHLFDITALVCCCHTYFIGMYRASVNSAMAARAFDNESVSWQAASGGQNVHRFCEIHSDGIPPRSRYI